MTPPSSAWWICTCTWPSEAAAGALADRRLRQDLAGLPLSLLNMGRIAVRRGRFAEALMWHRRGLLLAASPVQRVMALSHVALARARLADSPFVERLLTCAVTHNRRLANRTEQASVTSALAVLRRRQGRYAEAVALHHEALDLVREIGERRQVGDLLADLAYTVTAAGEPGAPELFREAAALAAASGHRHEQARSLVGLAACTGDAALHRRAAAMFAALGVPPPAP